MQAGATFFDCEAICRNMDEKKNCYDNDNDNEESKPTEVMCNTQKGMNDQKLCDTATQLTVRY